MSADTKGVSKYCARLAEEVGVAPNVVQTIFDHLRKLAIDALQQTKPFRLHSIATLRRRSYRATPAGTAEMHGRVFKTKPLPATRRVNCRVAMVLERTVLAPASTSQNPQTPAVKALCQALATSIGEEDITSDLVGKVITALRNDINL